MVSLNLATREIETDETFECLLHEQMTRKIPSKREINSPCLEIFIKCTYWTHSKATRLFSIYQSFFIFWQGHGLEYTDNGTATVCAKQDMERKTFLFHSQPWLHWKLAAESSLWSKFLNLNKSRLCSLKSWLKKFLKTQIKVEAIRKILIDK